MGWGLRADEDIGPYDLGAFCVARDDSGRALETGQREGRTLYCAPTVHHRMTREDQQQAPCWWGLPICPRGTRGGEHRGAELCPSTTRRSNQRKASSSGPRNIPGVRGTMVWRLKAAAPPENRFTIVPRRLFRPFLAGQKWAPVPRLSSFVFRPLFPVPRKKQKGRGRHIWRPYIAPARKRQFLIPNF